MNNNLINELIGIILNEKLNIDASSAITINDLRRDSGKKYGVTLSKYGDDYFDIINLNKSKGITHYKIAILDETFYLLDKNDEPIYKSNDIDQILDFVENEEQ